LFQKRILEFVVGCAGNIGKAMNFVACHFFTYLVGWMISNGLCS
jgi:hypothetical protein